MRRLLFTMICLIGFAGCGSDKGSSSSGGVLFACQILSDECTEYLKLPYDVQSFKNACLGTVSDHCPVTSDTVGACTRDVTDCAGKLQSTKIYFKSTLGTADELKASCEMAVDSGCSKTGAGTWEALATDGGAK